jgi:hypothetical protein
MVETPLDTCKYNAWHWLNQDTGEMRPFNCGSWNCPACQGKIAYHHACIVAAALPQRMITLTNVPKARDIASMAFSHLVRDIRVKFALEYARFVEVGALTGMLHYHLAQRGDYIPQRWLSARAAANGLGRIVHIEACSGKGPAFYLSKYITKEGAPLDFHKVSYSRGFPREKAEYNHEKAWMLIKTLDLEK